MIGWAQVAVAGTIEVSERGTDLGACVDCVQSIQCPEGTEAITGWSERSTGLLTRARTDGTLFASSARRSPWDLSAAADGTVDGDIGAVCADQANCFTRATAVTAVDPTAVKRVTAYCPEGTYAVAGGVEVTGTPSAAHIVSYGASGLFLPTGWRAEAISPGGVARWGLEVDVRCVPLEAMAAVRRDGAVEGQGHAATEVPTGVGVDSNADVSLEVCGEADAVGPLALSMSVGTPPEVAMGLEGWDVGSAVDGCVRGAAATTNTDPTFDVDATPVYPTATMMWVAGPEREAFDDAAVRCGAPPTAGDRWWHDLRADVEFGLVGDGGGLIWLPSVDPLPTDPWGPIYRPDALPLAIVTFTDGPAVEPQVADLMAELIAAGIGVSQVADLGDTSNLGDVVVFATPSEIVPCVRQVNEEITSIDWLLSHREQVAALTHPTILFLQADGAGLTYLRERWNVDPPTGDTGSADTGVSDSPPGCGCAGGGAAESVVLPALLLLLLRQRTARGASSPRSARGSLTHPRGSGPGPTTQAPARLLARPGRRLGLRQVSAAGAPEP